MELRSWPSTQRVLEKWAPIIANRYSELANLSKPITLQVGELEITFNMPEYWKYIELGRGPGKFPPPPAILDWITKKNILPRPINNITPTNNQLAYLIGRKISREGTQGKHALENTIEGIENAFITDLYLSVCKDISDSIV